MRVAAPAAEIPAAVRRELAEMGRADQAIREDFTPARMADTAFARRMWREDSACTARLREIVRAYGWPGPARAGKEAAEAAFLIVQHSPSREFRKEVLPILDSLARRGEAPLKDVALLTDRVLKEEGKPQRYGTQPGIVDRKLVPYPVEDERTLDARRAAMGLPPMSEYLRLAEQAYHAPVAPKR
ncbi:MAG: hypothetical protein IRZ00_07620 [Gemmatimonadetes bacterium]|nr:hypothetical protein [Gemmatimonadota bacterium]